MTKTITVSSDTSSFSELQKIINSTGNNATNYEFEPDCILEIDTPLTLYSNTEFSVQKNDEKKKFRINLMENAPVKKFTSSTPLITPKTPTSSQNICLHDFIFDGRKAHQAGVEAVYTKPWGHGYHNFFVGGKIGSVSYSNLVGFEMYNVDYLGGLGDLCRIEGGKKCYAHDITAIDGGHDVICFVVDGGEIYNNTIDMAVNAAIRCRSGKNIKIHDNIIKGTKDAYSPGCELQATARGWPTSDVEFYNNIVSDTYGPGVQIIGQYSGNGLITVRNNVFSGCGAMPAASNRPIVGAIVHNGVPVNIEYNTIDGSYGYGICAGHYDAKSTVKSSATYKRNIITNTRKALKSGGTQSGSGLANLVSSLCTITAEANCTYGNVTDVYNMTNKSGLSVDPLFVSSKDYHLQKESPCVFGDYQLGAYNGAESTDEGEDTEEPEIIEVYVPVQKVVKDAVNSYTTPYVQYGVQKPFVLDAGDRTIRLDQIGLNLSSSNSKVTASVKVTYQTGSKDVLLKEWTTKKTDYQSYSQPLSLTFSMKQDVTIKFWLKTSNKSYRARMKNVYVNYTLL